MLYAAVSTLTTLVTGVILLHAAVTAMHLTVFVTGKSLYMYQLCDLLYCVSFSILYLHDLYPSLVVKTVIILTSSVKHF